MMSDEDLMLSFQTGNRAAFDTLFERYRRPIWAFFRRRTGQPGEAEELTQDVFLVVLRGSSRYEPRAAFRSYLFGIAFNLIQAWRRRTATAAAPAVSAEIVPARTADPVASMWVRDALAALDPDDREIVMLREFDALSYAEIAALLDIPLNTVRSRLFRARAALKARLAGDVTPLEVRA